MTRETRRGAVGRVLVALAVLAGVAAEGGGRAEAGLSVGSDGSSVTVSGSKVGGESYLHVTGRGPAAMTCRDLVTQDGGMGEADAGGAGGAWPALDPTRTPKWRYWMVCTYPDGSSVPLANDGRGFVYVDEIVDVDAMARDFAESYVATRLAPALAIGSSPAGRALVGVPTWFWVGGVDAAPVRETHDVVGYRVDLELVVTGVTWDFGDDTTGSFGPEGLGVAGSAGPATHTFRHRSTASGSSGGTTVMATVTIGVSYTIDGQGPYVVDPPLQASTEATLVVREAQAVIGS